MYRYGTYLQVKDESKGLLGPPNLDGGAAKVESESVGSFRTAGMLLRRAY